MHGYFVASKLYEQARLIANPYVWEEERVKKIKEKVDNERASRIRGNKKVKVNQRLVDKILKKQENRSEVDTNAGILGDGRFGKLFEDEEFMVDETSREFQVLNPSTVIDRSTAPAPSEPTRYQAKDSEDELSDDEVGVRRHPSDGVQMRISSTQNNGRQVKDTALGSRQHGPARARAQRGDVVGERSVSFVPASRRKQNHENANAAAPEKKIQNARRSASGNTFRKL
jgi:ribosome biogenesis protein ENP2